MNPRKLRRVADGWARIYGALVAADVWGEFAAHKHASSSQAFRAQRRRLLFLKIVPTLCRELPRDLHAQAQEIVAVAKVTVASIEDPASIQELRSASAAQALSDSLNARMTSVHDAVRAWFAAAGITKLPDPEDLVRIAIAGILVTDPDMVQLSATKGGDGDSNG